MKPQRLHSRRWMGAHVRHQEVRCVLLHLKLWPLPERLPDGTIPFLAQSLGTTELRIRESVAKLRRDAWQEERDAQEARR